MIPFPFNKNRFSFFVADHLLVGQLCTNPKSNSSLLSCLNVTQRSKSEIGDAPLMLSTDPSYDNRTLASTLKMQVRTVQSVRAQLNALDDPLEVVERKDTARKTRTKEFIEKVQIARDLGVSHTTVNACMKEDLKCRSYRRQTSQILTEKTKNLRLIKSLRSPSSPDLNPLDYFVWSYVENITNMTSHSTKASLTAAIRRVFAGACGKGMLPVPDPYGGGNWGWRRLHWIDVSSIV